MTIVTTTQEYYDYLELCEKKLMFLLENVPNLDDMLEVMPEEEE